MNIKCIFSTRMSKDSSGKRADHRRKRAYNWTWRVPTFNVLGGRKGQLRNQRRKGWQAEVDAIPKRRVLLVTKAWFIFSD